MDSMSAFFRGQAAAHAGADFRVFDWDKAAKLIRERKPDVASAGLRDDWEYTGGVIYEDGEQVVLDDDCMHLASNWAIPELDMDGEVVECWRWEKESPGWTASTRWPQSALDLLTK